METTITTTTVGGSATFAQCSATFSFFPDEPVQGTVERYKRNGTAIQTSDGTFEFVPGDWHRSRAKLIRKLPHGRLTKTLAGDFLLTIRVSEYEPRPDRIIACDAEAATEALRTYLFMEEAA